MTKRGASRVDEEGMVSWRGNESESTWTEAQKAAIGKEGGVTRRRWLSNPRRVVVP